jgi:hypothetical protein
MMSVMRDFFSGMQGSVWFDRVHGLQFQDGVLTGGLMMAFISILTAMQTLAYLGMTAVLVWRFKAWSVGVLRHARTAFWPSVGTGVVFGILVPLGAALLALSFVGLVPAFLIMLAYVAVGVLAKIMSGMFLGAWLWATMGKRGVFEVTWTNALAGVVLLFVVTLIPLVGWIANALIMFAVFGVLSRMAVKTFWK